MPVSTMRGDVAMPHLTVRRLALTLSLVACQLLSGCDGRWTDTNIVESEGRGDRIAAALEAYRQDHGEYAPTLDALVPKYLPVLEPPTAGNGVWRYSRFRFPGGQGYDLSFGGSSREDPEAGRTHLPDGWSIDTK
jgi:hypothetical protein